MNSVKRSLSVKNMTLDQIKRIQQNNYCSEHDRNGKQYDYEANGYKDEIDARYWSLVTRSVDTALKQSSTLNNMPSNTVTAITAQKPLESANNGLKIDIEAMDIQISVLKAFNPWRFISNEITLKFL